MASSPVAQSREGLVYLTDGALAYAGHHAHERAHVIHTHNFMEIAFVVSGHGTHHCLTGHHKLEVGDVILLRPGVWHGYDHCQDLVLDTATLRECKIHLDALDQLRLEPRELHRGDIIGRLSLLLGHVARAVAADRQGRSVPAAPMHPVVMRAMRLLEVGLARRWSLAELAEELHLAPGYLVRLFKAATGLPPMAYLARCRAESAASLLLNTADPVSQIGRAVGWPDQNYFARRFKAHFGLSATDYRRRFTPNRAQLRAAPHTNASAVA
jgi:AraC family transcriptional regulator, L-rhamnose operon transcriptional activator RhaR